MERMHRQLIKELLQKSPDFETFTPSFLKLKACKSCARTPKGYCTNLAGDVFIRCLCGVCGPICSMVSLATFQWNKEQDNKKTA